MSPFTPLLRLHNRFLLRERIGRGGMSEVWRADDEVLHRPVAVKVLASPLAADPALRAIIQREARAAARLTHPHITQVYDYGEATLAGGLVVPYLIMELVDGQTLADRLSAGPLPWRDAIRVAAQVASALAAAHRMGVVHRDIKPGNVMLTPDGVKVLDFGIAALAGPHGSGDTGPLMGTPAYTAPERFGSGPPHPASDVYALGVLLYLTLTGRMPLPVQSWADALAVHGRGTPISPPAVPGLPAQTVELVMASLSPDPQRRPSAEELAERLDDAPKPASLTALLPTVPNSARSTPPHQGTLIDRRPVGVAHPGPLTGYPPSHPATEVTPGDWSTPTATKSPTVSRRGLLVGSVAAGGMVLTMLAASLLPGDETDTSSSATPPAVTTSDQPTEETPEETPPTTEAAPEPTTREEALNAFVAILDEAAASGQVPQGTADELRRKLDEVRQRIDGKPRELRKRVQELYRKIAEAVERREMPAETARQLGQMLAMAVGGNNAATEW